MEDNKKIRFIIDKLIDEKIEKNKKIFTFTFYEVFVKYKLEQKLEQDFIELAKVKLNNMEYKVFVKDEEFEFDNAYRKVQSNEVLIAVKR